MVFLGGLLAAFSAAPASASVITVDVTIDLSKAQMLVSAIEAGNYTNNAASLPLIAPVNVSAGDTLNYNISFANGQTLTIDGLEYVDGVLITQNEANGANVTMTGTLDLIGANGTVVASGTKTDTSGPLQVGQVFYANDLGSPASVTIAGIDYTGVVAGYDGGYVTRTYDSPNLAIVADNITVNSPVSVPEPFTLSLFGTGLFGAISARRKRKPARLAQV